MIVKLIPKLMWEEYFTFFFLAQYKSRTEWLVFRLFVLFVLFLFFVGKHFVLLIHQWMCHFLGNLPLVRDHWFKLPWAAGYSFSYFWFFILFKLKQVLDPICSPQQITLWSVWNIKNAVYKNFRVCVSYV